ncbi:ATP-dependent Clp protease ATP-binding subunit, partial [Patescibacteria group bacterium]|nr:ATP-dependent Clp protease ATP-binding subunit [Patescibacteria group bacterium]
LEGLANKLVNVLEEVEASGDIVLVIDEIQNLVTGMGEEGGYDSTIFSMLESYISKKRIRVIGATSMSNYRKYIEPNDAVARLFQVIKIEESSKEDTLLILRQVAKRLEREHSILITYPALLKSIDLTEKLIGDKVLPDKAIDLIERTSTSIKNSNKYLDSEEIVKEISEMTSIPLTAIGQNEADKLLNIGFDMKKRVIGQDHAIEKIQISLQRARTGIRDEKKPVASFLFVGMTGVGKTETAKALLETYFGKKENLIRLDMSEYQQIDSLNRIIGSPDGNIVGSLTEKIRSNPFSLLLIDEIEKAHPNILLTFLQMLDEGRLTDTAGNEANFTNTIIISTSNVGTKSIQEISERGGTYEQIQDSVMNEIRNKFAPELLNRFTGIIVFNPLTMENLREITKLMLERVKKVTEDKGISVNFKPELVDELIKRGYSPEWGARPLARVIEDSVESYIAVKILKKELKSGDRMMLGTEVFSI